MEMATVTPLQQHQQVLSTLPDSLLTSSASLSARTSGWLASLTIGWLTLHVSRA